MYVHASIEDSSVSGSAIKEQADRCIQRLLKSNTEGSRTSDTTIHHYSTSGLDVAARIIASSIGAGILLIPVFILFLFDMSRAKMFAVVGSFVLVFMIPCRSW
jgi:hypothetical protein